MPLDKNLNHKRAEIQGTSRLLLCLDVSSRAAALAAGYEEFGDILGYELKGEAQSEPVLKPVFGVMRQTDATPGLLTLGYELTTKAVADARKLRYLLAAKVGQDLAQGASNAVNADALVFTGPAPAVLNRWYDVLVGGGRKRFMSSLAIAGKTEGVDFIVDLEQGQVRFINPAALPAVNITCVVSAPAIDGTSEKAMVGWQPMQNQIWRGYARLITYDQNRTNRIVKEHNDFSFTLTMGKNFGVKHDAQSEASIIVMVAEDEGTVFQRN